MSGIATALEETLIEVAIRDNNTDYLDIKFPCIEEDYSEEPEPEVRSQKTVLMLIVFSFWWWIIVYPSKSASALVFYLLWVICTIIIITAFFSKDLIKEIS